ncbi:phenylalanine--tRNA ligase subunit beta [Vulgatibacter incomptus]|uniref:Phenylalanine--tRNA ligase beta subunit n=1 Tax=Vulgatibacter incomptus TaxID=1391653 RepID=A0A0K1PBN5_9BACT|nr:phenylalanine--tRNA ligase subunit beta [Vulgatibacter incomptus]AKU90534.1 Phenylalanyl-tRNA synthetase beta chain [Vulgatibacter incomptus]
MRISYKWLADLVEELPDVSELADKLTHAGLEVEGLERQGEGLSQVVVGQVLSKEPVAGSDKLNLCRVDVGGGDHLSIVCGAANYGVGAKVPTALVGAVLPGGLRIEPRKLRGVDSAGMLCSAKELALDEDASGLMLLDDALAVGTPIAKALGLDDVALELNATPNRPDWLSHLGVAREVVALTGTRLVAQPVAVRESGADASSLVSIGIERPDRCGRYAARVAEGVRFGPSPRWLRARLETCGVRSLGNVIDVTNYVLLETGHPLHAFDLDRVRGSRIVVRGAHAGEKLVTLDGKERTLDPDDLVIADAERALVLAGVMGGADAEVGEGTTRVLLESAYFDPAGIRRSSKRHGLHTESSHRFERGADPEAVAYALDRAAHLLGELTGCEIRKGAVDVRPTPRQPSSVALRYSRVGALLGAEVEARDSRRILVSLGFTPSEETEEGANFGVPSFRTDVSREADLVEEIARIRGYDSIPPAVPSASARPAVPSLDEQVLARVRAAMSGCGLDEVINLSFGDPEDFAHLGEAALLPIRNPLTVNLSAMRPTLLAGLLRNLAFNRNRQAADVRLYEQGRVFRPSPAVHEPVDESWHVAGVIAGSRAGGSWAAKPEPVDFYDAKGVLEAMLASLGIEPTWERGDAPCLHPRSACRVSAKGRVLGQLGELHPTVAEAFGLPRGVFVFELSMGNLVHAAHLLPHYEGVPRFPAVLRDLAAVVPSDLPAERLRGVLLGPAGEGLVEGVELFDVYEGPQVGPGRKNLAFAIRYRAKDRTLRDDEIDRVHQSLVAALEREVGAQLRA